MIKRKDQRIAVFIDTANMYHSAKHLYNARLNFKNVLEEAVSERQLIRAIAYTIRAESPEEQSFFDALEKLGFEVKSKDLQTFAGGHKKGDWDVGIAVDMLKMGPKLDAVILCSGDGDFADLLHHTKAEGCRAEVISFGRSTSQKLIDEADDFTDLDQIKQKVLLNKR